MNNFKFRLADILRYHDRVKSRHLIAHLQALADPQKAAFFPRFFKTGPGQYGEGDLFLGLTVPQVRASVKAFEDIPLSEIPVLLRHPMHEVRLAGLLLLVRRFEKADEAERARVIECYLGYLDRVNNWDLVDASAPYLLGRWLLDKDRSVLDAFARSTHLWTQRIAIVATLALIRNGETTDTFRIARLLLEHPHDLIHKAVGWMLREAGKRDLAALRSFLDCHAAVMPRTMLRYAIEKLVMAERAHYMGLKASRNVVS